PEDVIDATIPPQVDRAAQPRRPEDQADDQDHQHVSPIGAGAAGQAGPAGRRGSQVRSGVGVAHPASSSASGEPREATSAPADGLAPRPAPRPRGGPAAAVPWRRSVGPDSGLPRRTRRYTRVSPPGAEYASSHLSALGLSIGTTYLRNILMV